MLGILANNADLSFTPYYLALLADRLNRTPYFHDDILLYLKRIP